MRQFLPEGRANIVDWIKATIVCLSEKGNTLSPFSKVNWNTKMK